jgi:hypothetical protein
MKKTGSRLNCPSVCPVPHDMAISKFKALILVVFTSFLLGCESDKQDEHLILQIAASPQSIPVHGTSTITVRVVEIDGKPVRNVILDWRTTFAALEIQPGNTDQLGIKTATLRATGDAGTATITVRAVASQDIAEISVRIGLD